MSHFTRVKTVIRDKAILEETLRRLNYQIQVGDRVPIRSHQAKAKNGQIVIDTGSNYDIGFQRQADQTYAVCADWWGVERNTSIREKEFIEDINRTYALLTVKNQALAQGLIIEEEKILLNGEIELVICERF
ncbi:conserved hypothetical protein [Gammaproteobacteria bacterium]